MNNKIIKTSNLAMSKELLPIIKKNGKYGIALLGLFYVGNLMQNVIIKAMDEGYEVDMHASKENVGIKLTKPDSTWQETID